MTYNTVIDSVISDIIEKFEDGATTKKALQKATKQVLMDHEEQFKAIFGSVTKQKNKRAKTWSDLWRSKDYGARKFFTDEYDNLKKKMGTEYKHFTACKLLQDELENNNPQKLVEWVQKVRKINDDAPTDDPVPRQTDKNLVKRRKSSKTDGPKKIMSDSESDSKPRSKSKSKAKKLESESDKSSDSDSDDGKKQSKRNPLESSSDDSSDEE